MTILWDELHITGIKIFIELAIGSPVCGLTMLVIWISPFAGPSDRKVALTPFAANGAFRTQADGAVPKISNLCWPVSVTCANTGAAVNMNGIRTA
jgi:hypothetical protein